MSKYGLDDWKFALPVGILFGMPVIANEVSEGMINDEFDHHGRNIPLCSHIR